MHKSIITSDPLKLNDIRNILHLKRDPAGQWIYWITCAGRHTVTEQWGTYDRDTTIEQATQRFSVDAIAPDMVNIETESHMVEGNDWCEGGPQHQAFFAHPQPAGVKGCPMGRSSSSREDAINDLIRRTNMESGTTLTLAQMQVTQHRQTPSYNAHIASL